MAILDIGAELNRRIMALPDRGLEKIKHYLTGTGQASMANSLTRVDAVIVLSDTLSVDLIDFKLTHPSLAKDPALTQDHQFHNGTPVPQKETFTYTVTKESDFTFGFTEGLTVGVKATAKVNLPVVGGTSVQVSASFEFTAEQKWTYKNSQVIGAEYEIEIPPHSNVDVKALTQSGSTNVNFTANADTTGGVAEFACFQELPVPSASVVIPITAVLSTSELIVSIAGTVTGASYLEDWVEVKTNSTNERSTGKAGIRLIQRGASPRRDDTRLHPAASA